MSEVLKSLSDGLASVVETASPGIVRVEARRRLPGSGIVWSSDGVIVTAHHIVERTENINIGLHDGTVVPAAFVGRDPNTDLAVLHVDASLTPPAWSDADDLKVGHLVLALGRPGENVQATLGVVSAIEEEQIEERRRQRHGGHGERGGRGGRGRWGEFRPGPGVGGIAIQTDVVMYPGFSGGPLVDAAGFVRGMNTSAMSRGTSLTIATPAVRRVIEALLSHGKVKRGYLGIGAQPVRLPAALSQQLEQEIGLMLVSVEAGSPAEKGGLLLGDILVGLDDYPVQVVDELLMLLNSDRVGQEVTARIIRGGQLQDVNLTVGERE
jgi:S1-C subfamily serine protease